MATEKFAVGDRIKVTIEGEATRVLQCGPGQELRVDTGDGECHYVYAGDPKAVVEKVEPPVETFEPGDVVRDRYNHALTYALGREGYTVLHDHYGYKGGWYSSSLAQFTSEGYERVEVG